MPQSFKLFPLLFTALFIANICEAQNDDMTDTRRKTESFARFHYGTLRADLATFAIAGLSESVNTTPLQKIDYTALSNNSIVFEGDGIKATVEIASFDPSKHKLQYDEKYLIQIDRRTFYGSYGNVPKTSISNVSVIIDKDTIAIPATAFADLHNLNFTYLDKGVERTRDAVYKSKDGHTIYLYLFSRDDSGSYEVTWVIQDKKYLRRVLDYGIM